MKIGIDCHAVEEESSGNCTYIRNLLSCLAASDRDNEYVLFVNQVDHLYYAPFANSPNVTLCPVSKSPSFFRVFVALAWASYRQKIDVLHVQYFAPLFHRGRLAVTIHDLTPFRYPEYFSRVDRLLFHCLLPSTARRASLVLTACRNSKEDLVELFGLSEARIKVTYYGVSPKFSSSGDVREDREILKSYHLDGPFILYVGRIDPRKNIPRLIEAYDLLRKEWGVPLKLIIVGKVYLMPGSMKIALQKCHHADDVLFFGSVPDQHLPALYRGASVFVYPSDYEGFGFPPLEAMACGVPVVASDIAIFREILGDAAFLVPVKEPGTIAEAIARVLTDGELRNSLIGKGKEHVKKYNWQRTAMETLEGFRQIAGNNRST